jgi:hypothetical protein
MLPSRYRVAETAFAVPVCCEAVRERIGHISGLTMSMSTLR